MPEDLMNTTDQPQFDKMAADGVALCTYPGGAKQYAFFYMGLLIKQDDKVLVRDRNGFAIVTVKRLVTVDDPKTDLLRVLSSDLMNHAREKAVRAMFTKYIDDPTSPAELFDFQKSGMEKALRKYCNEHNLRYPGDVEAPNRTNETVTYPSNFTVHKHEEDE